MAGSARAASRVVGDVGFMVVVGFRGLSEFLPLFCSAPDWRPRSKNGSPSHEQTVAIVNYMRPDNISHLSAVQWD